MAKSKKADLDLASMSIPEAIEALNGKYGENTLILASEAKGAQIKHVSTGSYALDIALGGGIPENRITEIRGPFSSFKSTISLLTIRNFQQKYSDGYGVYVDLEKTFDRKYARRLGVDLSRLVLVNPDSGEQAIDAIKDLLQLRIQVLMVVDSIAALIPTAEVVSEAEQQHMGLQARLVNKMMRIVTSRLKRSLYDDEAPSTTVVCLNQLRQKIGVVYGNPETSPGGEGKNFAYSTIIRLNAAPSKVIAIEETRNGVKHSVRYGQLVTFKIQKNKCGGPQHEEGEFSFFEKDYKDHEALSFDNAEALFHYGAFYRIINFDPRTGYKWKMVSGKNETTFLKDLKKYPQLHSKLYQQVLDAVMPGNSKRKIIRLLSNV